MALPALHAELSGRRGTPLQSSRIPPSCAREETPESRGMPCLFLNTERGFGGKPPKKSGFRRHLAGQKCLKRRFSRRSPVGEWSRAISPNTIDLLLEAGYVYLGNG